MPVQASPAVHGPAYTVHHVKNTGQVVLRHVNVVAHIKQGANPEAYDFVIVIPHTSFIFVLPM